MGNPVKGEVTFEVGGKAYTFRLGINAQCMIENRVGMTMTKYMAEKSDSMGAADTRMLFHAGLYQHHQLTEDEVGDLLDELGLQRAAEIFLKAAGLASAPESANGSGGTHPLQSAGQRIGMNS